MKRDFEVYIAEESYKTRSGRQVTPEFIAVQNFPKTLLVFEGKTGIIRNIDQIKKELDIDTRELSLPSDTPVELILYCQPGNESELLEFLNENQNLGRIMIWLIDIPRKQIIKIGGERHHDRNFDIAVNRGFPIPDFPPVELVPLLLTDSLGTITKKIFESLGRDGIIKGFEGNTELIFSIDFVKEIIRINLSPNKILKAIEIGIELDLCEAVSENGEEEKYKLKMNLKNRSSQSAYFNRLTTIDDYIESLKRPYKKTLMDFFE